MKNVEIVKNTLKTLAVFGATLFSTYQSMGQTYLYLEDVISDPPPAPTPGMALIDNKFPKISFSETQPKDAERLAKYGLVVFRGNANKAQLAEDTKAINPNIIALKYTHPVEYIANSSAPQEFPFTGSGPKSNGSGKVYAGHWLYKAGKRTTTSMTASSTTVTVNNSSGFNAGKYVVIYDPPMGSFNNAEQALIGSRSGNTITFSVRGYKSTAQSHPSNAIIALHDLGQGGDEKNWRYNMSTECPLDGNGKQMNEVMADWHADNLLLDDYPNGTPRPDLFDGIEFDADQNSVPNTDVDNNLQNDDGYMGTENAWVNGVETFYQLLRNRHPDKYIIGGAHNTMGFDVLNGNQLESWPSGGNFQNAPDYENMDGYLSRAQFQLRYRQIAPIYMECLSKTPSPSYPDPQPKGNGPQNHKAHRFHFGLALLDDGFYVEARHGNGPDMNTHYPGGIQDFWYDEYSVNVTDPVGSANYGKSIHGKTGSQTALRTHSQWLGAALGPRKRIYDNTFASSNNMISNGTFDANKNGWLGTSVTISRVTTGTFEGAGSLHASTMNSFKSSSFGATVKSPTFSVTNGKEYTVCWALRASEYREFNVKVGNHLSSTPKFNGGPAWVRYVMTFKATSTASNQRVIIGVGGHDTEVWVDEVYVFEGNANVFRRDFENGIVVVNATHSSKTIQLGETFKRIDGHLDPANDGVESSSITLQKFDSAVFVRLNQVPPPPASDPYFFEQESLAIANSSGDSATIASNANASGGEFVYFHSDAVGDSITFELDVQQAANYQINVGVGPMPLGGVVELKVDGVPVGTAQDLYSSSYTFGEINFGSYSFATAGTKQFQFEVVGKNVASSGYKMRLDYVRLVNADSEVELLPVTASSGDSNSIISNSNASGGAFLKYNADQTGDFIEFDVSVAAGEYDVLCTVGPTSNSAIVQLSVVGEQNVGLPQDLYSGSSNFEERNFGRITFSTAGTKVFRYEVSGKNASSSGYLMRLDRLKIVDVSANISPTLTPINDQSTDETCITVTHITATDPDPGDVIILSSSNLPAFATLQDNGDGTGLLIINPGETDAGEYSVTIIASDGINSDSTQFLLTVVDS